MLAEIGVACLSPEQIALVHDGTVPGFNLCHYNPQLMEELHVEAPVGTKDKRALLKKISIEYLSRHFCCLLS
jgi:hypothetical protein